MGDSGLKRIIKPTNIPTPHVSEGGPWPLRNSNRRTRKDGQDCFMDGLDLLLLQNVTRKEREYQQHDQNEQRPGAEELLGARFGSICFNHHRLDIARRTEVEGEGRVPSSGSDSYSATLPRSSSRGISIGRFYFSRFCAIKTKGSRHGNNA